MSTELPRPMFLNYFSLFTSWSYTVIVHDGCLLTTGNDSSECSIGENTIVSETGDMPATESSDVPTLDSESFDYKSVTWSDFVVSVDNNESIEYKRMSSEAGTAEGSVGVSESKIPVELENRKP